MEGLANARLKDTSCNRLRLTGKPVGLIGFMRPFLTAFFLETGELHSFNEPLACMAGVSVPVRRSGASYSYLCAFDLRRNTRRA
jgi:hypothetical protein